MALRGRGRPPKGVLTEDIELVMARKNVRLERHVKMLDNGSVVQEHWLIDTHTGERTRTTKAKGVKHIETVGQGVLFE